MATAVLVLLPVAANAADLSKFSDNEVRAMAEYCDQLFSQPPKCNAYSDVKVRSPSGNIVVKTVCGKLDTSAPYSVPACRDAHAEQARRAAGQGNVADQPVNPLTAAGHAYAASSPDDKARWVKTMLGVNE